MGTLVVSEFVSLDGVMEAPGGDPGFARGGWAFEFNRGEDGDKVKLDEILAAESLLLGRTTYEEFAAAWPSMTDEVGFADKMNSMPKYVVSSTLRDTLWNNTTVLSGNVADEVAQLKTQYSGDILINGSGTLARTLAEHGLVDEYRLMVFPIIVGAGKRLLGDTADTTRLHLVDAMPVGPDGVVVMTYRSSEGFMSVRH